MRIAFLALVILSVCFVLLCLVSTNSLPLVLASCFVTSSSCPGDPKSVTAKNITGRRSNTSSIHGYPAILSSKALVDPTQNEAITPERWSGDNDRFGDTRPAEAVPAVTPPLTSIVCQLSGEMGNCLDKYAHCYAVSRLLYARFRVKSRIVIRHQEHPKWRRAAKDLNACFPFFRSRNFEEGNSPVFQQRLTEQSLLMGDDLSTKLVGFFAPEAAYRFVHPEVVNAALRTFATFAPQHGVAPIDRLVSAPNVSSSTSRSNDQRRISLPFLYVSWMYTADPFHDEFIDDFRRLFAYDTLNTTFHCCGVLPDDDETVLHLRNFVVEMPRVGPNLGFHEMGPRQMARDLVGHLQSGDKVAIVSRFAQETAQPYIDALTERGLHVRFISGQTGVQDFCFLMQARKEMIGIAISTYFMWAAYLSNCTRVIAYSVDTAQRRDHFGDDYLHCNFSNPILAGRISFPIFSLDR